jgi:hypothetical protein
MIIVRLLSPGPWLVGTTKVYSGVGADIVMESIALIDLVLKVADCAGSRRYCLTAWKTSRPPTLWDEVGSCPTISDAFGTTWDGF